MFVPMLLEQVRVKDRPEIFLVFRLDRAKQTVDLLCLGPDIVERGLHWAMLQDVWDDSGQAGPSCEPLPPWPVSDSPRYSSIFQKHSW